MHALVMNRNDDRDARGVSHQLSDPPLEPPLFLQPRKRPFEAQSKVNFWNIYQRLNQRSIFGMYINVWRQIPTKWLQERPKFSKTTPA